MLLQQYIAYFEQIATQHRAIGHVPGSLHADALPESCRFATYNATDVLLKRQRTKIGYPALLAEVYEWEQKGTVYDPKREYRAAFSIVSRARANDAADEIAQLDLCETIMQQVVHRLYKDHYGPDADACSSPFRYIDVPGGEAMCFGPIWENVFGWRFEFAFRPRLPINFSDKLSPDVWRHVNS